MLMFIAYCDCTVFKTPNDSKGASKYWEAKAEQTRVDTTTTIITFGVIFGVIFGLPIVCLLIFGLVMGLMWIVEKICDIFKKEENTEPIFNGKVEDGLY